MNKLDQQEFKFIGEYLTRFMSDSKEENTNEEEEFDREIEAQADQRVREFIQANK